MNKVFQQFTVTFRPTNNENKYKIQFRTTITGNNIGRNGDASNGFNLRVVFRLYEYNVYAVYCWEHLLKHFRFYVKAS